MRRCDPWKGPAIPCGSRLALAVKGRSEYVNIRDDPHNQFKLAKIQGEFVWHQHVDTDEVFVVLSGNMKIELRDGCVELSAGEMYVVPRGVEHKPVAEQECQILLIEPAGVLNTGDAGGEMTAENDIWL